MLSIVVPTFNEAENAPRLVEEIASALEGLAFEVVFVDDSTDDTPAVLAALAAARPNVRFEHRAVSTGLATAVLRGFEMAAGDFIAVMDADLQHPPAILRPMLAAVEDGADICVPSRFIPGGSDGGLNLYRKLVSAVARYIGKIALPALRGISDPTGGLFMFRRQVTAGRALKPIGWKILIEVLAMGDYERVTEIPYAFRDRTAGDSKLSSKVTLQYLKQVLGLMRRAQKRRGALVTRWSAERAETAARALTR